MKTKIYNSFFDKFGKEYNFNNYLDFSIFWFNLSFRYAKVMFPNFVKLQKYALSSKEAKTKLILNENTIAN